MTVTIIGAGIGGLTLALCLHRQGIPCRVYEAVPELKPLGVGINLLPHGTRVLDGLGLLPQLDAVAIRTREQAFFNHHGQFVYSEPAGTFAGYDWPQLSIHRGDLQMILLHAVRERLGEDAVVEEAPVAGVEQTGRGTVLRLADPAGATVEGSVTIACDGIHSVVRRQFYPDEGAPVYSGINMWRGVTRMKPVLTGASQVRIGALKTGKIVLYPIRDDIDGEGTQLVNWVAEIETETYEKNDWNRPGRIEDFFPIFENWRFDWIDAAAMIEKADAILEYPMVDRDPLPRWTYDRVTLLGDAAHAMYPRGSNGAAQAILDAEALEAAFAEHGVGPEALVAYEEARREKVNRVVVTNRSTPPDHIINTVEALTDGKPFDNIDDVISQAELKAIADNYRAVTGNVIRPKQG